MRNYMVRKKRSFIVCITPQRRDAAGIFHAKAEIDHV